MVIPIKVKHQDVCVLYGILKDDRMFDAINSGLKYIFTHD